ncbi:MAG: hypothetical protein IAF94_09465 [Pirellulaceae bacterium]|nr:hypothetical protein [Pirellulaceae bacterium]
MFRFSIRDCLLAVPLAAVCFAWVCEKGRLETMQDEAEGLSLEMLKQEQQFRLREAALKAKLMPPYPRARCQLGTFEGPDCWDPRSTIPD